METTAARPDEEEQTPAQARGTRYWLAAERDREPKVGSRHKESSSGSEQLEGGAVEAATRRKRRRQPQATQRGEVEAGNLTVNGTPAASTATKRGKKQPERAETCQTRADAALAPAIFNFFVFTLVVTNSFTHPKFETSNTLNNFHQPW